MEKIHLHRKNLVVTADDFGISPVANENILLLAEAGKLDRVAVMTNGSWSKNEIERLEKTGVKLDIHLDLSESIPAKRKLTGGVVFRGLKFLVKYAANHAGRNLQEIRWEKQFEKFKKIFGRYPDGINSHQHIHFFPAYFKMIRRLAEKHKIGFVRFGKKGLIKSKSNVYRILNPLRRLDAKNFSASGLDSTDYMVSLDWVSDTKRLLKSLVDNQIEIVCHPERPDEFELMRKYF